MVGPGSGGTIDPGHIARIEADPEFIRLTRQRSRLGLAVTAVIVVVYFGYILLLAYAPGLMRSHVSDSITLGFPLGLGVLLITFLLVALHVGRSASVFDPACARIVDRSRT